MILCLEIPSVKALTPDPLSKAGRAGRTVSELLELDWTSMSVWASDKAARIPESQHTIMIKWRRFSNIHKEKACIYCGPGVVKTTFCNVGARQCQVCTSVYVYTCIYTVCGYGGSSCTSQKPLGKSQHTKKTAALRNVSNNAWKKSMVISINIELVPVTLMSRTSPSHK